MKTNKLIAQYGIIDIELYYPNYYVSQAELEDYDKVGKGKYTIGLGQSNMAIVGDREDINSICLTVLDRLLLKNKIEKSKIGRLEIGTETFVDKSKSIKTYLMDFFKDINHDIEGISTSNACYGGTNALFNAINWLYSDYYDGRYAIVICADIAVYSKGSARPTGGAGAVAILLGSGASIQVEPIRSTYMNNFYDFYKPDPTSEYPVVDGHFSIDCYFKSLEQCFETLVRKYSSNNVAITLNNFDYFCFHSPFSKNVEKAFYHLLAYDMAFNNNILQFGTLAPNDYYSSSQKAKELLKFFETRKKDFKIDNKLFSEIKLAFSNMFKERVEQSLYLGKNLGNIYTGSLYIGLLSLILNENINLTGKKVLMFSYGSGAAASMFTLNFKTSAYKEIMTKRREIVTELSKRIKISPSLFDSIMLRKEKLFLKNNYSPEDKIEDLREGTFYLEKIDDKWRRYYIKKETNSSEIRRVEFNKLSNKSNPLKRLNLLKDQLGSNDSKLGLSNKVTIEDSIWNGFHKKTIQERQLQIKKINKDVNIEILKTGGLTMQRADSMVENCIGVISMPIGLGLNFTINNKKYVVPMAVEEPSVIAAVSVTAKLISNNNGFFCYADPPIMISQIHITDTDTDVTSKILLENKDKFISVSNNIIQNMVQRGGGVQDIHVRILKNCKYYNNV